LVLILQSKPPLPDGRIFTQMTQKKPQKIFIGLKILEAVKLLNFARSGRKPAGKHFNNYLEEIPLNICIFLAKNIRVLVRFFKVEWYQSCHQSSFKEYMLSARFFLNFHPIPWPETFE
jgi:hypothetical protein